MEAKLSIEGKKIENFVKMISRKNAINIGFSMCLNANVFNNKYLHSTKDIFGDAPFKKKYK